MKLPAATALLALVACNSTPGSAPAPPVSSTAAIPEHASLDSIVAATYEVISGPAGPRDWERCNALFHPTGARLMSVGRNPEGRVGVRVMTPDEYARNAGAYFAENPFYEVEVARRVEYYGHIAHVFSTYESRTEPDGEPFSRGINSFQLLWDEDRWWVLTIYWDAETPEQPIPEHYLGG